VSDQKQMSQADREAWLSMAGDDFLPWLQQEVGVAMAKLGLRDNLKEFKDRLDKLEVANISEHVALESMKRTADGLQILGGKVESVLTLLRRLEERMTQHAVAMTLLAKQIYQAPKIGEGPAPVTEPEVVPEPPAAPKGPVLTPKFQRVYDYIVKHQGQTQAEIGFALEHSKTTLCEMLTVLSHHGLVTHDRAKTPNGGTTFRYYPTEGRESAPKVDGTFLDRVITAARKHPWSTAGELVDKVDWGDRLPSVHTMSVTLSHAVSHKMLRSHRKIGDLTRYADWDAPSALEAPVAPTPVVQPVPVAKAPVPRVHSLHEQLVLKVLKTVTEPVEVPWITGQIESVFGTSVLNNSVNSVCIRLEREGLLTSVPIRPGSRRKRYMLAGQATSK